MLGSCSKKEDETKSIRDFYYHLMEIEPLLKLKKAEIKLDRVIVSDSEYSEAADKAVTKSTDKNTFVLKAFKIPDALVKMIEGKSEDLALQNLSFEKTGKPYFEIDQKDFFDGTFNIEVPRTLLKNSDAIYWVIQTKEQADGEVENEQSYLFTTLSDGKQKNISFSVSTSLAVDIVKRSSIPQISSSYIESFDSIVGKLSVCENDLVEKFGEINFLELGEETWELGVKKWVDLIKQYTKQCLLATASLQESIMALLTTNDEGYQNLLKLDTSIELSAELQEFIVEFIAGREPLIAFDEKLVLFHNQINAEYMLEVFRALLERTNYLEIEEVVYKEADFAEGIPQYPPTRLIYLDVGPDVIGESITPVGPHVDGGEPTEYTISPDLPAGLSIDSGTGIISGIPEEANNDKEYTVRGKNMFGSVSTTIKIDILFNETASFTLASQDADEGDTITVAVSLSSASDMQITIPYTVEGTANINIDHNLQSGNIIIPPGYSTYELKVKIEENDSLDSGRTIIVSFYDPINVNLGEFTVHTITILGDKLELESPDEDELFTESTVQFSGLCIYGEKIAISYSSSEGFGSSNPTEANCVACTVSDHSECAEAANRRGRYSFSVDLAGYNGERIITLAQSAYNKSIERTIYYASITQEAELNASTPQSSARFGNSVVIYDDWMVIGEPNRDESNQSGAGVVYVYKRNTNTWSFEQKLTAGTNNGLGDRFGKSVDIYGNYMVVGAEEEDGSATTINGEENNDASAAGAAYVFKFNGSIWVKETYLKPSYVSDQANQYYFGSSVGIYGTTVVVGAYKDGTNATGANASTPELAGSLADNADTFESGAVWVFVTDGGGTWTEQAYLKASDPGYEDNFGKSVSIYEDTVVVGAAGEDDIDVSPGGGGDDGAVYVFKRSGTVWGDPTKIKNSNLVAGDAFGGSVDIYSGTIVVSATGRDSDTVTDGGGVYVYTGSGSSWSEQAYLQPSNPDDNDKFGSSVTVYSDTILVGAVDESSGTTGINYSPDNNKSSSGAAYVFVREGISWSQEVFLKASSVSSGDGFGNAVSLYDNRWVVGASKKDGSSTSDSGAVYVFKFIISE